MFVLEFTLNKITDYPAGIYLFKVNDGIAEKSEIYSKLIIKIPERHQ